MTGPAGDEGLKLLGNVVHKLLANNARFSDVEYRVLSPAVHGRPYIIELSKGRCNRQVMVDSLTVQRLTLSRQADAGLTRELRTAILYVMRLSERTR